VSNPASSGGGKDHEVALTAGDGGFVPAPSAATRWDAALLRWPRAHVLQSFGYGTVQADLGWRPRRLEVAVPGRPSLPILALVGSIVPGLPRRVYIPKGPACAPDDAEGWEAALGALERLAATERAATLEIEPHAWAEELPALGARLGPRWTAAATTRQPAATALVDLEGGIDAILARMRPKGRYNVRLAARRGVECAEVADPEEAAGVMGPLLADTSRRQDAHLPDARHISSVLGAMPTASVLVARVDGEPVSGLLLATFGAEAVYLYGGSSERHRDRQPSAALQAFAMERAAQAGCTSYDLWGIPPDADPGHPWHGLRQFKLNLGGVERRTAGALVLERRRAAARIAVGAEAVKKRTSRLVHDAGARLRRARARPSEELGIS
jgi:lipid II:glycine glycyltransferase (peptidoglycan interpeptide bridge formation enzyme)